jgi:alpha-glucosidase
VMSNHDFDRLATRLGAANVRDAATLLLLLPGIVFLYQGDEIGLANGPGADPAYDRAGRDAMRHPMQWDGSANGGFTTGRPWLPASDPAERNVEAQRGDPESLLDHYRRLIALRRELGRDFRFLDAAAGELAFARGGKTFSLEVTRKAR